MGVMSGCVAEPVMEEPDYHVRGQMPSPPRSPRYLYGIGIYAGIEITETPFGSNYLKINWHDIRDLGWGPLLRVAGMPYVPDR